MIWARASAAASSRASRAMQSLNDIFEKKCGGEEKLDFHFRIYKKTVRRHARAHMGGRGDGCKKTKKDMWKCQGYNMQKKKQNIAKWEKERKSSKNFTEIEEREKEQEIDFFHHHGIWKEFFKNVMNSQ